MSHPVPTPVRRAGPFELIEPIALPGSGQWFRAQRVTYSRGNNAVLVCIASDAAAHDPLRSAHEALATLHDRRLPQVVGWYEGVGALAVTASTGPVLAKALCHRTSGTLGMTPATLLDLGVELCEVLVHLHESGRTHGAVIPHHITLSSSGDVVLWGTGEGLGTPSEWRAPDRGPTSMASDQWHLAATLAALVTGKAPWANGMSRSGECACATDLGTQWPSFTRVIERMTARNPSHRYPSLHEVRRELLRLARRASSPSQRRELGAALSSLPPAPRSAMAQPPRIQLPLPNTPTPATDIDDVDTAPPASARAHVPTPRESVPVVRPSVGDYVPTASVRPAASSFADVPIHPNTPNSDIAVVAVEFDDTDHGQPRPIGMSMATDDLPVPTPEDVFGALEMPVDHPLDAPKASASVVPPVPVLSPQPAAGLHSGPTAVPTTDPGFGAVSLDLGHEEDSFFSDGAAGVQGIDNLPTVNPRRNGPREPSMVERVAHGMVIANAGLFALWFVVRVF